MAAINFRLPEESFVSKVKQLKLKDQVKVYQWKKFQGYSFI